MKKTIPLFFTLLATAAYAEETRHLARHLDRHEHGVGALNIALDGKTLMMEFMAPGADVVGFEHAAETAEDKAKIKAVLAVLEQPLSLFELPTDARCTIHDAKAALKGEEQHMHDEQDEQADHEGHEDHHDHEEHEDHDAHADHEDHDAHEEHEGHHHEGDMDHEGHSEFHADYVLHCENPAGLSDMRFAYFDLFANAQALQVQTVSAQGAQAEKVTRDAPVLDLSDKF